MKDASPVPVGDATDRVAENTEGEDGGTGPCGKGGNVVGPGETVVEEDAKITHGMGYRYAELGVGCAEVKVRKGGTKKVRRPGRWGEGERACELCYVHALWENFRDFVAAIAGIM